MLPELLKKIQLGLLEISKRITSWFFALFVSGCLWIILGVINLLILDGGPARGARFLGKRPLFSPSRWANLRVFDAPPFSFGGGARWVALGALRKAPCREGVEAYLSWRLVGQEVGGERAGDCWAVGRL